MGTGLARVLRGGGGPDYIGNLNSENSLNFITQLSSNNDPNDPDDFNQYAELTIDSAFYDPSLFITKFSRSNRPLFLNINIQSLNSKYEKLKNFILSMTNNNIQIDLIALQETWSIKHPQLLDIPGFQQLVYKNRSRDRGGGVGFYIRNGLTYSVNNELSVFDFR